jgi:hypothetical protein
MVESDLVVEYNIRVLAGCNRAAAGIFSSVLASGGWELKV